MTASSRTVRFLCCPTCHTHENGQRCKALRMRTFPRNSVPKLATPPLHSKCYCFMIHEVSPDSREWRKDWNDGLDDEEDGKVNPWANPTPVEP